MVPRDDRRQFDWCLALSLVVSSGTVLLVGGLPLTHALVLAAVTPVGVALVLLGDGQSEGERRQ